MFGSFEARKDIEKKWNYAKALVAGVALTGTSLEAQTDTFVISPSNSVQTITIEDSADIRAKAENARIMAYLVNLETQMKGESKKHEHAKKHVAYAVVTESSTIGTFGSDTTKMEAVLAQDAEAVLINNPERTYMMPSRDQGSVHTLKTERKDFMGSDKAFETYIPIDYYIVVGFHQLNDSIAETVIRVVDMNTNVIETYVLSYTPAHRDVDGGYAHITPTVEQKIKEIVKEKNTQK